MSLTKKVFKNVSYLLIARAAFRFLTAGVLLYATTYLGAERFGMLETATAWANSFLALNDVGMSTLIVREAARDEKKMALYFGNTLVVEVILSIVLYVVILGVGFGLNYDSTTMTLMMIMGAAGLAFEFRKVMRGIFRVLLKLKFVAMLEVINGLLYLLFAIWIFATVTDKDLGLLGLAHSRLWVNVLIVVALFLYTLKFIKPTFALNQVWPMVKQSYVFTLYNVFFMLYFEIDQIILSIMKDATEVGIYGAPAKIVNLLLFIPIMIFQVTMPIMYRYSKNDIEKYKRINHATWRYIAAFGVPAGLGLWFLAPEIMNWFAVRDPAYFLSIPVLHVFGWFLVIRFIGISQGNSLTTTDRQGLRAFIQILSLGVNIVLDIWLIQKYGAYGAATATLITEVMITSSYLYFSARYLKESIPKNLLSLLPIFAASAGMLGILALAKPHVHVIVLVIFGFIVYALLLWVFRFFKSYDRKIIQQITQK